MTKREAYKNFKVGDRVVLARKFLGDLWVSALYSNYIGRIGTINKKDGDDYTVEVITDDGVYIWWSPTGLDLVTTKKAVDTNEMYKLLQKKWVELNDIKVGDTVKAIKNWREGEQGFNYCDVLPNYLNKPMRIESIEDDSITLPYGTQYPFFVLEKIDDQYKTISIQNSDLHIKHERFDIIVNSDLTIKFGQDLFNKTESEKFITILRKYIDLNCGAVLSLYNKGLTVNEARIIVKTYDSFNK